MRTLVCIAVLMVGEGAHAGATVVHDFTIDVHGAPADGIYAAPAHVRRLVVVAHGYTHTVDSWRESLVTLVHTTDSLVVAMNYPKTFTGVARGAEETVAAVAHFRAMYPSIRETYLLSVSMGNIVAAIALAEHDVFNWWIDVEGVSNLAETWLEGKAAGHAAAADIESECGGTPVTAPAEYTRRSAVFRVDEIASQHRLRGAIVVHAPADGLVPYDQTRELVSRLTETGVSTDLYTVVGRDCRLNTEGNTTIMGYAGANPDCLAGHASERLTDHVIMRTAFAALADLVARRRVPRGTNEMLIDEPYAPVSPH